MSKNAILLKSILAKNTFGYLLIDKSLKILDTSEQITNILKTKNKTTCIGKDILDFFPELFGFEDEINALFTIKEKTFDLNNIDKNGKYINISLEYYSDDVLLLLIQNVSDTITTKQAMLQHNNELLLFTNILQKTLDSQNAYIFLTLNDTLYLGNKKLLEYFDVESIEQLQDENIELYTFYDKQCDSYKTLYEEVGHKEIYIKIKDDNFILKASSLEATYKIFTLTMITDISRKLLCDPLTLAYKQEYLEKNLKIHLDEGKHAAISAFYIDNFKTIHNQYGAKVCENILKEFSSFIKDCIGSEDILSRWSEDEFILFTKQTDLNDYVPQIESIFKHIGEHVFSSIKHLDISVGVALTEKDDTVPSLLLRANSALYKAQKTEGNTLIVKKLKKKK